MSEIGMVDSSCAEAGEVCGNPLPISGWALAHIRSKYPDDYENLLCKLRELDNGLIRKLEDNNWQRNGVFYQHVIPITRYTDVEKLYEELDKVGNVEFNRDLFGYAFDGDHIHVFHDCAKGNGSCRCSWRKLNFPDGTKTKVGERTPLRFIGSKWIHIILYYLFRKRGTQKIWINGVLQGFSVSGKLLFWDNVLFRLYGRNLLTDQELRREQIKGRYEQILDRQKGGDYVLGQSEHDSVTRWSGDKHPRDDGAHDESTGSVHGRKRVKVSYGELVWGDVLKEVQQLLSTTFEFPISQIRTRPEFRENLRLTNPDNMRYVNEALADFSIDINLFSLRHFHQLYKMKTTHIFDRSRYLADAYYSLEESLEVIDELIRFQYDDDDERIFNFLTVLVDILDKRQPKLNTMVIESPPSAGKNYFFDMIFNVMINVGYLHTANKNNQFAFMDAYNKRVIVWNEVNYEPSQTDMCKQITGGDTCTVAYKNKPPVLITRTPLFCMCNQQCPFQYEDAFAQRVVQTHWKYAGFLKDKHKYPYPLAFFSLLEKYNVDFGKLPDWETGFPSIYKKTKQNKI